MPKGMRASGERIGEGQGCGSLVVIVTGKGDLGSQGRVGGAVGEREVRGVSLHTLPRSLSVGCKAREERPTDFQTSRVEEVGGCASAGEIKPEEGDRTKVQGGTQAIGSPCF